MFQSVISRFAGACRTLAAGLAATVCAAVATSCADGAADKEEKAAEAAAEAFASCYFNYDFAGARPYCTESSLKWLSFAASNVTQTDLDVLKTQREEMGLREPHAAVRVLRNGWFWIRRSIRLFRLMPAEAFFFVFGKTYKRLCTIVCKTLKLKYITH